jgi:hypothetical protein
MTWKASSISSQAEVEDSVVSRESDSYCFLGCSRRFLVDFTLSGSTINAAAYQETLKILKKAIRRKRPGFFLPMDSEFFSCTIMLFLTVLPQQ